MPIEEEEEEKKKKKKKKKKKVCNVARGIKFVFYLIWAFCSFVVLVECL